MEKNNTTIISGFPAVGKSYYTNDYPEYQPQNWATDSDSSKFSWIKKGLRNPDFPNNYIKHIKECIGIYAVVFVSSHKDVRDALVDNGIDFTLVYPKRELKKEYIQRFKDRGNEQSFIDLVKLNWDDWIDELEQQQGCKKIVLGEGEYLSNTNLELKIHKH